MSVTKKFEEMLLRVTIIAKTGNSQKAGLNIYKNTQLRKI